MTNTKKPQMSRLEIKNRRMAIEAQRKKMITEKRALLKPWNAKKRIWEQTLLILQEACNHPEMVSREEGLLAWGVCVDCGYLGFVKDSKTIKAL